MFEKIDRIDANLHRVLETAPDQQRRGRDQPDEEEGQKKDKDKFEKGKTSWRKMVSEVSSPSISASMKWQTGKKLEFSEHTDSGVYFSPQQIDEEGSVTLRQDFFVLSGLLDQKGQPRVPVIMTYAMVVGVIAFSLTLILRILWR